MPMSFTYRGKVNVAMFAATEFMEIIAMFKNNAFGTDAFLHFMWMTAVSCLMIGAAEVVLAFAAAYFFIEVNWYYLILMIWSGAGLAAIGLVLLLITLVSSAINAKRFNAMVAEKLTIG